MTVLGFIIGLIIFIAVLIFVVTYIASVWQVWWQLWDTVFPTKKKEDSHNPECSSPKITAEIKAARHKRTTAVIFPLHDVPFCLSIRFPLPCLSVRRTVRSYWRRRQSSDWEPMEQRA